MINRAQGKCELCGELGFVKEAGGYYLETHHVIYLSEKGPDTPKNVIALCADHHREAHFGREAEVLEKKMIEILDTKTRRSAKVVKPEYL